MSNDWNWWEAGYAKSNRSRCKVCKEVIPKDEPRIGLSCELGDHGGGPGGAGGWFCMLKGCYLRARTWRTTPDLDTTGDIRGYADLEDEHQELVQKQLTGLVKIPGSKSKKAAKATVLKRGNQFVVSGQTFTIKNDLKNIGCKWNASGKEWVVDASPATESALCKYFKLSKITATAQTANAAEESEKDEEEEEEEAKEEEEEEEEEEKEEEEEEEEADEETFEVEEIIEERHVKKGRKKVHEVLVRWQGYGPEHDTWEPADGMETDAPDAWKAFQAGNTGDAKPPKKPKAKAKAKATKAPAASKQVSAVTTQPSTKRKRTPSKKAQVLSEDEEEFSEDDSYGMSDDDSDEDYSKKKRGAKKKKKTAAKKPQQKAQKAAQQAASSAPKSAREQALDKYNAMKIPDLKELLRKNWQRITGTKDELVERCVDGELNGAVPKCPKCMGGNLNADGYGGFFCKGFYDEDYYRPCHHRCREADIKRMPWNP